MSRIDLDKILDRVREVTRDVVAPEAEAVDRDRKWPEQGLRALQAAGLGGLVVTEEGGGLGHGLGALVRACEIIGRTCASTALCFGMHCVATAVISARATPLQQETFLEPICAGTHLTTLALSEPGTGAFFWLPQTKLAEDGTDFVVSGAKTFVTNGDHADSYVVSTVAADPSAPPGMFSCLVIPGRSEGLVWGGPWEGLGMRGNSSRSVELRDVRVPQAYLLGREGDEIWYVFNVVAPYFLIAMAGTYLGIGAAALGEARRHVSERRYSHTGAALADSPVIQHRLGTLWGQLERTRCLVYHAAAEADAAGSDAVLGVCAAKAEVAEAVVSLVGEAMTVMGGIAYRDNSSMERHLRDARAAHVMAPTTDVLRLWIGRLLLDRPLLAD